MQDPGIPEKMQVLMDKEPELPEVASDDKVLIRNIIYTVMALNKVDPFCKGWQVQCVNRGYIVIFFLNPGFAVSVHDMVMIRELNASRITNVMVNATPVKDTSVSTTNKDSASASSFGKPVLRVQVLDCKQPVMYYDADVVRVRKKGRQSL
jgi:hypothetical protein